jgi:hypothetical protein
MLVVIVALAAAWRISYFQHARPLPGGGDAVEYDIIATTLLDHGRFVTPDHGLPHGKYAVRTPGYPAFLAAIYWAGERAFGSKFALLRPVQVMLDLVALPVFGGRHQSRIPRRSRSCCGRRLCWFSRSGSSAAARDLLSPPG